MYRRSKLRRLIVSLDSRLRGTGMGGRATRCFTGFPPPLTACRGKLSREWIGPPAAVPLPRRWEPSGIMGRLKGDCLYHWIPAFAGMAVGGDAGMAVGGDAGRGGAGMVRVARDGYIWGQSKNSCEFLTLTPGSYVFRRNTRVRRGIPGPAPRFLHPR